MTFSTYRFYVTVKILTEDILPRLSILVDDPLHEFRVEVSDFFRADGLCQRRTSRPPVVNT